MIHENIEQTTSSTGSGNIQLDAVLSGRLSFLAAFGLNKPFIYYIRVSGTEAWERGRGTLISANPDIMSRVVIESSNGNAALNLPPSTLKRVYCAQDSETARFGAVGMIPVATGTATALEVAYSPSVRYLDDGAEFKFKAASAAAGASTLNIDGKGAKSIVTLSGSAIYANAWAAGDTVQVVFDSANNRFVCLGIMQSLNIPGNFLASGTGGFGGNVGIGTSANSNELDVRKTKTGGNYVTSRVRNDASDTFAAAQLLVENGLSAQLMSRLVGNAGYVGMGSNDPLNLITGGNNQISIDANGALSTGGASAATGYTGRGDLTLPSGRRIRADNTSKCEFAFTVSGAVVTVLRNGHLSSITRTAAGRFSVNPLYAIDNGIVFGWCIIAGTVTVGGCLGGSNTNAIPSNTSYPVVTNRINGSANDALDPVFCAGGIM